MSTWPDLAEVTASIGVVNDSDTVAIEQCRQAAVEYLTYRCEILLDEDNDDEPIVPESVRTACILLTTRLFRRRQSPEGVAAWGDLGAIRISRIDPDIEAMLLPARSWGIA